MVFTNILDFVSQNYYNAQYMKLQSKDHSFMIIVYFKI